MPKFNLPNFDRINWSDWKTYCLLPFVLLSYAFWKPLEALRTRVWDKSGWEGGFLHEVLAIAGGVGAAISAYATPHLFLSSLIHQTGEGIVAFLFTWAYIFPIIWLILLRPAYDGVKWCWNHLDFVDKNIVGPLLKFTPRFFSWLPGARAGWARMKDNNWFLVLIGGITYVSLGLFALYIGWQAKGWVVHSVHINGFTHEFVLGVGWAALILVAGFLGRIFFGAMSEGGKEGLGTISAAAVTYASAGWLNQLSASVGVPSLVTLLAVFIIGATYGLPLLYIVFASGFWKKVLATIEPALTDYFSGKETPFRHVVLQLVGVGLAFAGAFGAYHLCGLVGANVFALIVIPLFVLAAIYAGVSEVLDTDYGNPLVDVIVSLGVGAVAGLFYSEGGFVFGNYGAIVAGVVATVATFIVIPLTYALVQWFATLPGIIVITNWAGGALTQLHKLYIDEVVQPVLDACESVYNEGYGHYNGKDAKVANNFAAFNKLALHGTNAAVAVTLTGLTYFGVASLGFLHAFAPLVGVAVAALVLLNSVGVLGKAILSAGLELPGVLVSLLSGLALGGLVLPVVPAGLWLAAPIGVFTAAVTYGLAFPVAMIVLRAITGWAAPTVTVWFDWITDRAWRIARAFWKGFGKLFDFVYDLLEPLWKWIGRFFAWIGRGFAWIGALLAPFWLTIAGIVSAVWGSCKEIWNGIFGGK